MAGLFDRRGLGPWSSWSNTPDDFLGGQLVRAHTQLLQLNESDENEILLQVDAVEQDIPDRN